MIQRIQTLYLLLASIFMLVVLFFPLAVFRCESGGYYEMDVIQVSFNGKYFFSTIALFFIGSASALIALVTIFMHKKRMRQIRLTLFNTFLIIGFIAYVVYLIFFFSKQLTAQWTLGIVLALPIICIILNYLAIRAIGADEALIRSLNRLR